MEFLKRIIAVFILVSFVVLYLLYNIIRADDVAMALVIIISPIIIVCLLVWAIYVVVEWYVG